MVLVTRVIFCVAMVVLGIVSMWTTYVSLHDSILPTPEVRFSLGNGIVWDCSVFALGLSVAIGMMLFALKLGIIDEHKRLNFLGLIGLIVVGFISISFNLDVLYRTADRDFFIRYSTQKMRGVYEKYMEETQAKLVSKRDECLKVVARQEGELDAEIRGLREAPRGYGKIAKQEDYQLTLLEKTSQVELDSVKEALAKKEEADTLLRETLPASIEEVEQLQNQLRVVVKDIGAMSGVPLPDVVKLESPLFAVFEKVFNWRTVGIKEIFFVIIALFLDLGDIVGYSLVPDKTKKKKVSDLAALPDFDAPEVVLPGSRGRALAEPEKVEAPLGLTDESVSDGLMQELPAEAVGDTPVERSLRFRR